MDRASLCKSGYLILYQWHLSAIECYSNFSQDVQLAICDPALVNLFESSLTMSAKLLIHSDSELFHMLCCSFCLVFFPTLGLDSMLPSEKGHSDNGNQVISLKVIAES